MYCELIIHLPKIYDKKVMFSIFRDKILDILSKHYSNCVLQAHAGI